MEPGVLITNAGIEPIIIGHQALLPGERRIVAPGVYENARAIYGEAVQVVTPPQVDVAPEPSAEPESPVLEPDAPAEPPAVASKPTRKRG